MNVLLYDVKQNWEDACASIKCPNCGEELYLDSQNAWTKCDCGHTYTCSLLIYEVVDDKENYQSIKNNDGYMKE